MTAIKNATAGRKTYIVATGLALFALGGVMANLHGYDEAAKMLFEAFGLIALRLGVEKSKPK